MSLLEKKSDFLLSGQGVSPPYTLSGPTTKKKKKLCVSSLINAEDFNFSDVPQLKKCNFNLFDFLPNPPEYMFCILKDLHTISIII